MPGKAKNAHVPILPEGWKTASMMAQEHGGSYRTWQKRFDALKDERLKLLCGRGMGTSAAWTVIDRDWVGERRPPRGQITDAASPRAQQRLKQPQKLKVGWATAAMMAKELGGDRQTWQREMRNMAKKLIRLMKEQCDLSSADARQVVEDDLIGPRQHKSWTSLAASPEGKRLLKEDYEPRDYSRTGRRYGGNGDSHSR